MARNMKGIFGNMVRMPMNYVAASLVLFCDVIKCMPAAVTSDLDTTQRSGEGSKECADEELEPTASSSQQEATTADVQGTVDPIYSTVLMSVILICAVISLVLITTLSITIIYTKYKPFFVRRRRRRMERAGLVPKAATREVIVN